MIESTLKNTRTYGRRRGRPIKISKQFLLTEFLPTLNIQLDDTAEESIDPQVYFTQQTPVWIEVGFGGGEHISALAREHQDINFIGCEPFENGVVSLLGHIYQHNLKNVRIFQGNALDLLKTFQKDCLSRFYLMFPDPWPKKRHHKRRFIQGIILDNIIPKFKIGSNFCIATDHADYQKWMLEHFRSRSDLTEITCTFDKQDGWPDTRYESKAIHEGRFPMYMVYTRRS